MIFAVALTINTLGAAAGMVITTLAIAGVVGLFVANFKNSKHEQVDRNISDATVAAQATITILKEQISAQQADMVGRDKQHAVEITELRNKYTESGKAIANLQGQISSMKDIPLRDIASSLLSINAILEKSATTLAVNTKAAAAAVSDVKEDLLASHT